MHKCYESDLETKHNIKSNSLVVKKIELLRKQDTLAKSFLKSSCDRFSECVFPFLKGKNIFNSHAAKKKFFKKERERFTKVTKYYFP